MTANSLLTTLSQPWREIIRALIHFIYPPFCILCTSSSVEQNQLICDTCWAELPALENNGVTTTELKAEMSGEVYFDEAVSVWKFSPLVQNIIHHLKYRDFKKLAHQMGTLMAKKIALLSPPEKNVILIPVPLHKTKKRERGYNQSTLLCQALSHETGFVYDDRILKRIRYTKSQTKLSAQERQKNVSRAFKITDREKVAGKTIILVDDVITTGATMNSCARELRHSGAEKIHLLSAVKA